MKVLIDTHVFLWWVNGDPISEAAQSILHDSDAMVYVSVASLWEMTIKVSLGKLTLSSPVGIFFPVQLKMNAFNLLPVGINHLAVLETLPFHHRDPFDRLLIAQTAAESMSILSVDTCFDRYPVARIW